MKYTVSFCALLLTYAGWGQAGEHELKRLFYTPEQRVQIEQARQAYLHPSPKVQRSAPRSINRQGAPKPTVSAIIVLPDGQRQVRVNGRYQSLSDNRVQLDARGKVAKSNDVE
ncbi:hypothetical protein AVO42_05245 [Thiomicrospira sp. XS5]|uniref:hypothetical protein n=1 Tax=Thiomicrospira sp. XS5 TaxID=1775636 RepID=UPI0007460442|nr:hypothetical protein [Thiomicrospira sp. XS5]KUJ74795.1 hypothetical protein AVO42_05245 [Thiomicrospira sp. XS5]